MWNSIIMAVAGIVFVAFWTYLAWDSHTDLKDDK